MDKNMLLINPSALPKRTAPEASGSFSMYAPLSVLTVARKLLEDGGNPAVIDTRLYSFHGGLMEIYDALDDHDTIGISVNTYTIAESVVISGLAHALDKRVVWGGIHPKLYPTQCTGIADEVIMNDLQPKNPLPAYELTDAEDYITRNHKDGNTYRMLDIQLTRGCPYRCSFCINPILHGKSYTKPSAAKAIKAVNTMVGTYKLDHVVFFDENFFVDQQWAEKVIASLPEGVTFTADCRANYFRDMNDSLKQLLKDRCVMLSIGAESGSQRVLDYIRKDITLDDIHHANETCRELDVIPNFSFMIGLPTETISEMKQTMRFILELKAANLGIYYTPQQPFRAYPGSPLYNELKEKGLVNEPEKLADWIGYDWNAMPWLSNKEKEFMKRMVWLSGRARMPGGSFRSKAGYAGSNMILKVMV